MGILFRSEKKLTALLDPRHDFAPAEVESEIRFDPLTADTARICHFTGMAPQMPDMAVLAAATEANCPFCPAQVGRVTPRFPPDFIDDAAFGAHGTGRLQRGEATLFPNLFPYDDVSAIAVMSRAHYLAPSAIPASAVADTIKLARDFFIACGRRPSSADAYGLLTWNYLPASGGSQVHPHMQVALSTHAGNRLARELAAEGQYLAQHRHSYAFDLLAQERSGPRWLFDDGVSSWLVPYAPTGIMGDAIAYFPDKTCIADLSDAEVDVFSASLVRVVAAFARLGLGSFNLSFFPERSSETSGRHWLSARLLPRFYLNNALHVSDASYLQLLLQESFCMQCPEQVARQLRHHLSLAASGATT